MRIRLGRHEYSIDGGAVRRQFAALRQTVIGHRATPPAATRTGPRPRNAVLQANLPNPTRQAVPLLAEGEIGNIFDTARRNAEAATLPAPAPGWDLPALEVKDFTPRHLGRLAVRLPAPRRRAPSPSGSLLSTRPTWMRHGSSTSPSASSVWSTQSATVVWQLDLKDVTGEKVPVQLRIGGEKRLIASVPQDRQGLLKQVIDQAPDADIGVLSLASQGSDGMASFPVVLDGVEHVAVLSFDVEGRVTKFDVSNTELETEFAALDPELSAPSTSATSAAPLVLPGHLQARVNIEPRIDRKDLGAGRGDYRYFPRLDHGLRVVASPSGELWLALIQCNDQYRNVHGSGTDMLIGMAKKLQADGVNVSSIRAAWADQAGLDSQYLAFRQAIQDGATQEEAAKRTFSGKAAVAFGFSDVHVFETHGGDYIVNFRRPATPA